MADKREGKENIFSDSGKTRQYIQVWKEKKSETVAANSTAGAKKVEDSFIVLGLSGGGILSATFGLGVMQVLEKIDSQLNLACNKLKDMADLVEHN